LNKDFIPIGKIISSYGLKGELKVLLYNEKSNMLNENFNVWLFFENKFNSLVIETVKVYKQYKLIKFKSINDRTSVDAIKSNKILYASRKDFPKLNKDDFYLIDLIGFDVESDNLIVGKIIDIINLPTNNSLLVLGDDSIEFMIPILEEFVKFFDFENSKVIVKNSEIFIK